MSHRRYNPLLDEWVIVSTNRLQRPWQGAQEASSNAASTNGVASQTQTKNPLAPGGQRANGTVTPNYTNTYVFPNDFPIFCSDKDAPKSEVKTDEEDENDGLFYKETSYGTNRVICYHPDSKKAIVNLSVEEIQLVVKEFMRQVTELKLEHDWVQIFENKGQMVGCSNPHPHCQLWASKYLPNGPATKNRTQKNYYEKHGKVMLLEYLNKELKKKERIVVTNQYWTVLVPYWAYWPYEVMVLPNRHILRLDEITEEESLALSDIIKKLLIKYDNVFKCEFPYTMGWLGAPTGKYLNEDCSHWMLHAVYYPPLVRSATVKKFMGGYEMVCESQRDFVPELAAEILRNQPDVHYLDEGEKK
uniref:Galactose-1-phosphate uridylyltransferase n=1 Tax=Acrobeloides nanus TaxID=290746 RepID=A0A914DAN3_9BILA